MLKKSVLVNISLHQGCPHYFGLVTTTPSKGDLPTRWNYLKKINLYLNVAPS